MLIETEKHLDKKLKKVIEVNLKGIYWKIPAIHISGIPDRLCLLPKGIIFFVELKTMGQKPRAIQLYIHRKLRELGFMVIIVDNSQTITHILEKYGH
jgi:hypothetical protein